MGAPRGDGPWLARGRTYARKGQVTSLDVVAGQVTALVQGSRARPYRVLVGVAQRSAADWDRAEAELNGRGIFLATLLAGEMPTAVENAFAVCDLTLFPATSDDLDTACSCPDWANPCKHVAAVYYLLAEAFDDDLEQLTNRFALEGLITLAAHKDSRSGPGGAAPVHGPLRLIGLRAAVASARRGRHPDRRTPRP